MPVLQLRDHILVVHSHQALVMLDRGGSASTGIIDIIT
jgi:hypothetical protein